MSLVTFDRDRPNPLHILADAMDAVRDHGYDQVIVVVMKSDAEIINWSTMTASNLTYGVTMLQKKVMSSL